MGAGVPGALGGRGRGFAQEGGAGGAEGGDHRAQQQGGQGGRCAEPQGALGGGVGGGGELEMVRTREQRGAADLEQPQVAPKPQEGGGAPPVVPLSKMGGQKREGGGLDPVPRPAVAGAGLGAVPAEAQREEPPSQGQDGDAARPSAPRTVAVEASPHASQRT